MNDLRKAAQAILDRWNSPVWDWHRQGHTGDLMEQLRNALDAQNAATEELLAQIKRLSIRNEAYENAYRIAYQATFQSHTGHWDATGQHGAGCSECIRAREARENCDKVLREGADALITAAQKGTHEPV